jgi:carbonic anhydrase
MTWKTPSEHTVNNRQFSAELQIFHTQPDNDRSVALSILFDDELADVLGKRAKTCFVNSFDFELYGAGIKG